MSPINFRILLLTATLATSALHASTPEENAERFLQECSERGIDAIVEWLHPDDFAEIVEQGSPLVDSLVQQPQVQELFASSADSESAEQLHGLSKDQFVKKFLEYATAVEPEEGEDLNFVGAKILGHVMEGDVAHVLVRIVEADETLQKDSLEVISFEDVDGEPKIRIFDGITELIEQCEEHLETSDAGSGPVEVEGEAEVQENEKPVGGVY
jgi:hypothetical protein